MIVITDTNTVPEERTELEMSPESCIEDMLKCLEYMMTICEQHITDDYDDITERVYLFLDSR